MILSKLNKLIIRGGSYCSKRTYSSSNPIVFIDGVRTPFLASLTGKSLSEALIFASTNPQYDNRLFIELQVQYMKIQSSNLGRTCCIQKLFLKFRTIFVHNMFCKKKSFWQRISWISCKQCYLNTLMIIS